MDTENGYGTLYLCATPIGNLGDITERVLETLRSVDLIAAEDTRNTLKLLNHFDIRKPMTSYHDHNRFDKAEELVAQLKEGKDIACVTDAGTPGISDPGEVLCRRCIEEGIRVTSLPGACALVTALTLSGMPARRFCFEGFLPTDKKEKKRILGQLCDEERTTILYEAPHRLRETLRELQEAFGDGSRKLTICRELTKKYEEAVPTTLQEAGLFYENNEPRGEYVLVLAGADPEALQKRRQAEWEKMGVAEHVAMYEQQGFDRREAMKKAADDRNVSRRDIYRQLLEDTGKTQDGSILHQ
ncbi:MAG: 16S rRNA (cytidine(1402)-2'-O)-methyltransferase [Lachnospiraceae bacterium]|jgi:16S rRNA (cytidine1402-2'-O)-methyltransferase|nr:16S rRNA (cytidine(1402)-2'-O)-methyltransferase [Lachnospiraceae bacterium]